MRLVFLGTPAFAVPTLESLVAAGYDVLSVVTQPDRPSGRGQRLAASPVKEAALGLGLPVYQPERIRRPEAVAALAGLRPDAMVVVGYGQILPQTVLDIPPHGIINVHASLLPEYRRARAMGHRQRRHAHWRDYHAHRCGARHRRDAVESGHGNRTG
jgi:methionyl-tRNA formyltransferase